MYIVNKELDGDQYYHVHVEGMPCGPKTNYENLTLTHLPFAIAEAKALLGKENVKACSICCE